MANIVARAFDFVPHNTLRRVEVPGAVSVPGPTTMPDHCNIPLLIHIFGNNHGSCIVSPLVFYHHFIISLLVDRREMELKPSLPIRA